MEQEGYLSPQMYKITLSAEYFNLFQEALTQSKEASWSLLADRGREFPQVVVQTSEINLRSASGADVGVLISYFAFMGKSVEETLENMTFERS